MRVMQGECIEPMHYDTRRRVARSGTSDIKFCSHAYSRKYSRFARLGTLGFKTPYFRNLAYLSDIKQMAVNYVVDWKSTREPTKKKAGLTTCLFVVFRAQNDNS